MFLVLVYPNYFVAAALPEPLSSVSRKRTVWTRWLNIRMDHVCDRGPALNKQQGTRKKKGRNFMNTF
jgi:hypothetical protein